MDDRRRVLVCSDTEELQPYLEAGQAPLAFEMAGPRTQIFFEIESHTGPCALCGSI